METVEEQPKKKKTTRWQRFKRGVVVMFGGTVLDTEMADNLMDSYIKKMTEAVARDRDDNDADMNDKYLFDFKKGYLDGDFGIGGGVAYGNLDAIDVDRGEDNAPSEQPAPPTKKVVITPKQVLKELEVKPTPFAVELLDEKISILEDKAKMIKQRYAKREVEALKERLENRKKYPEFKRYFDKFDNTDDEKIDVFIKKHGFVMKTSDIFIPEFPDDAIKTMTEYTEKVEALCEKKPTFYVIAEQDKFRKAYEKRDPILLAQSPFGFYWQILGAWDKEMLLLHEL